MSSAHQRNAAIAADITSCSDDSNFQFFEILPRTMSTFQLSSTIYRSPIFGGITALKILFITILTLSIVLYLSFMYVNTKTSASFDLKRISTASKEKRAIPEWTKPRKPPLILTWTRYFRKTLAEELYGGMKGCDYQCTVTNDRKVEASADAIAFHIRDLNNLDLPRNRSSNQLYLFYLYESPENTGNALDKVPKDFFNLTITYRRDSDIFSPYGMLRKIDNDTTGDQIWNWTEVEKSVESKTGMVLQFVSSCKTSSRREKYVDQLKRYVKTTQRGKCNGIRCDMECAKRLSAEHRFYLSFENSVCRDYITEKLFDRMRELLVPIVLKKSLYIDTLPPGSYIAVDDFKSPRELANYLNYLGRNTTAYLSYFEWTKNYQKGTGFGGYCALCKYLHEHAESGSGSKVVQDIRSWWFDGGQCVRDYALPFMEML